jgi:glycosyltransferase involved in cell wall biosynthesis
MEVRPSRPNIPGPFASVVSVAEPRLSVLIPVYNGDRYLRTALDSALREVGPRDEVLVADDLSTDGSSSILEEYDGQIARIANPTHEGLPANHNVLLRRARGEYLTFLHQDDELLGGSLQSRRETLDAHPALGLVSGDSVFVDAGGTPLGPPQTPALPQPCDLRSDDSGSRERVRYRALAEVVQRNPFQVGSVMLRRSHVERVGGFWESLQMALDYDYWLRSLLYAPLVHLPTPVLRFRVHELQASQSFREHPNTAQSEIYLAMTHARNEVRRLGSHVPSKILAKWDAITLLRGAMSNLPASWLRAVPSPIARTWGDLFGM